ncbi:MAG: Brp/Blh family beta-carotene 15,15'-dioxygenase, partial [Planctomycetota bacterium]
MSSVPTSLPISTPSREAATPSPGLSLGWLARPLIVAAAIPLAAAIDPAWIWAVSLLIIGMPHGAYDLAAIHRLTARRLGRTSAVFSAYTAIMLACVAAFVVAPTVTLAAFLVLTAHHFGISDSVATRGGQRHGWFAHAAGFARGLVVISSPFAFQPDLAWAPFVAMGELVGGTVPLNEAAVRLTAG